jgi:hypothetical protein
VRADANKKEVMELRGIDYILRLLKTKDETVNRWACNAIGILCMENGMPVVLAPSLSCENAVLPSANRQSP